MKLIDNLISYSRQTPSRTALSYTDDSGTVTASITYSELETSTRLLATSLLSSASSNSSSATPTLKRGDRIVLVFLPSLEFFVSFLACLRAGLVAVPVYPPDPRAGASGARGNAGHFSSICAGSGAKVALSHAAFLTVCSVERLKAFFGKIFGGADAVSSGWPELTWLSADLHGTLSGAAHMANSISSVVKIDDFSAINNDKNGDDNGGLGSKGSNIAFLQYTSGSTSEPKGVAVTHDGLSHNLLTIVSALRADQNTIVVSWLPQYHDMGLVGSCMALIYCGGQGVYLSPKAFIKRPTLWLNLISTHRATHVQAPNFAFQLSARKFIDESARRPTASAALSPPIDLSCLKHVFNAAESVTALAVLDFISTFATVGFNASSLSPGYGLAENTVYVCDGGSKILFLKRDELEVHSRAIPVRSSVDITSLTKVVKAGSALMPTGGGGKQQASLPSRPQDQAKLSRDDLTPSHDVAVLVSCGHVAPYSNRPFNGQPSSASAGPFPGEHGINVAIVDPDSRALIDVENIVGEVWVASDSKAAGYFGKPTVTQEAFYARLEPPVVSQTTTAASTHPPSTSALTEANTKRLSSEKVSSLMQLSFLRTGDLGFISDGELVICGRKKDLLIVRGRNYFPQDIEQRLEATEAKRIRPGCSAVFADSYGSGSEAIVVACEVRQEVGLGELSNLSASLYIAVQKEFGISLTGVILLAQRAVVKTTSGKVARQWNAKAYGKFVRGDATGPWGAQKDVGKASSCVRMWNRELQPHDSIESNVEPILLGVDNNTNDQQHLGAIHTQGGGGGGDDDDSSHDVDSLVTSPYALSVGQGSIGTLSNLSRARRLSGLRIRTPLGNERPSSMDVRELQPPPQHQEQQEQQPSLSGGLQLRVPSSLSINAATGLNQNSEGSGVEDEEDLATLLGAKLELKLVKDIAHHINGGGSSHQSSSSSSVSVPVDVALIHLGLDSLSLTQLQGMLQHEYKIAIPDELVFAEETTIKWMVDNEKYLRGRAPWPVSSTTASNLTATNNVTSTIGVSSITGVSTLPLSTSAPITSSTRRRSGADGAAVTGSAATATTSAAATTTRPTPMRRPRRQPSALETNCPCFLICFSD